MLTDEQLKGKYIRYIPEITEEIFNKIVAKFNKYGIDCDYKGFKRWGYLNFDYHNLSSKELYIQTMEAANGYTEISYKDIIGEEEWWKNLKKGDYFVVTKSCGGYNGELNHIYKAEKDGYYYSEEDFRIPYETGLSSTIGLQHIDIRPATPDEIKMYEHASKPVDITTYKLPEKNLNRKDLIEGEIYLYDNRHIALYPEGGSLSISNNEFTPNEAWMWTLDIKSATSEEKQWLKVCIAEDKFVEKDYALREYDMYGKALKSEVISEYVECTGTAANSSEYTLGKIYKLEDDRIRTDKGYLPVSMYRPNERYYDFYTFKSSTKEAYEAQFMLQQPKVKEMEKPKFEIGKWYKNLGDGGYVGKLCGEVTNYRFPCKEYLNGSGVYTSAGTYFVGFEKAVEAAYEDYGEYLPDRHPDKIIKKEYMNTMNIEVGDTVKCVSEKGISKFGKGNNGSGWESNLEFIVASINNHGEYNIYFRPDRGNGVYSDAVTLVKRKEQSKSFQVHDKCNIGDIIVTTEVPKDVTSRKNGDLHQVLQKSNSKYLYYKTNLCIENQNKDTYRLTTSEEVKMYNDGIRNINDVKKEEDYKVGDWCYIISAGTSQLEKGKVYQINEINPKDFQQKHHFDNGSGSKNNGCWLYTHEFRKATAEEVPLPFTQKYQIGDWVLTSNNANGWGSPSKNICNKILQITNFIRSGYQKNGGKYFFGELKTVGSEIVRKATPEEIANVTGSVALVVGNWYELHTSGSRWIFKFLKYEYPEKIWNSASATPHDGYTDESEGYLSGKLKDCKPANMEEVYRLFPKEKSGDKFTLPEKWCIKVTEENKEVIFKWRTASACTIGGYCVNKIPGQYTIGYWYNYKPTGYEEITFEQFKKYVLKENVSEGEKVNEFVEGQWYKHVRSEDSFSYYQGNNKGCGFWKGVWKEEITTSNPSEWKSCTINDVKELLFDEARTRYPLGCEYNGVSENGSTTSSKYKPTEIKPYIFGRNSIALQELEGLVYANGVWAVVVSKGSSEEITSYDGLKVGDALPEKVICAWGNKDNNRTSKGTNYVWAPGGTFIGDRVIEGFKEISGEMGFLVSGSAQVYLKAKGFKSFMESYNKPDKAQITENSFEVGDLVVITKKPTKWSSGANGNYPLFLVKYPFTAKITKIIQSEGHLAAEIGNYGWDLSCLIKEGCIVKAITTSSSIFAEYALSQWKTIREVYDEPVAKESYKRNKLELKKFNVKKLV